MCVPNFRDGRDGHGNSNLPKVRDHGKFNLPKVRDHEDCITKTRPLLCNYTRCIYLNSSAIACTVVSITIALKGGALDIGVELRSAGPQNLKC